MKILLARPAPDPETIGLQHIMLVEPLELEVMAATLEEPHTCAIVDMALEQDTFADILAREEPDLLGVTGYITNVPGMIDLCRTAKQAIPSIHTVAGGVHCEVVPDDLDSEWIDYRVVRNAATVFPLLVDHAAGKAPRPPGVLTIGQRHETACLPDRDFLFPRPRRDLTRHYRDRYFYVFHKHVALMKTSFGCPHNCTFCFCRSITGGIYRQRDMSDVLCELSSIAEPEIYIVDDDFLADRSRVASFISECRTRRIVKHYLIYGRSDFIAANPGLMSEFRKIGLRTVIVGLESFAGNELDSYNKGSDVAANEEALRVLRRLDIDCYATLILPPHWGRGEFQELRRKLRMHGVRYVNLQPLTPLPGIEAKNAGIPLVDPAEFPKWDLAHVMFKPERLSVADYYREIVHTYDHVLFRMPTLFDHLRRHPIREVAKMAAGSLRVRRQYDRKIREARRG